MHLRLIAATYSCIGQPGTGAWNGPQRYLRAGAEQLLASRGFRITVEPITLDPPGTDLFSSVIAINQKLAEAVRQAIADGEFPLIVSGTCDVCMGVISGLEHSQTGIIWCDAHGDFNTPATSPGGFFGGMPLSIVTGHCHHDLWSQVGNHTPIPDSRVLLVDARDLDPLERENVERAAIPIVPVSELQSSEPSTSSPLTAFTAHTRNIYLHLDIDILDPHEAPGLDYRTPNGPSIQELERAIATIGKHQHIQAAAMTAYNPDLDQGDKTLQAGLRLLVQLAESARTASGA